MGVGLSGGCAAVQLAAAASCSAALAQAGGPSPAFVSAGAVLLVAGAGVICGLGYRAVAQAARLPWCRLDKNAVRFYGYSLR